MRSNPLETHSTITILGQQKGGFKKIGGFKIVGQCLSPNNTQFTTFFSKILLLSHSSVRQSHFYVATLWDCLMELNETFTTTSSHNTIARLVFFRIWMTFWFLIYIHGRLRGYHKVTFAHSLSNNMSTWYDLDLMCSW